MGNQAIQAAFSFMDLAMRNRPKDTPRYIRRAKKAPIRPVLKSMKGNSVESVYMGKTSLKN